MGFEDDPFGCMLAWYRCCCWSSWHRFEYEFSLDNTRGLCATESGAEDDGDSLSFSLSDECLPVRAVKGFIVALKKLDRFLCPCWAGDPGADGAPDDDEGKASYAYPGVVGACPAGDQVPEGEGGRVSGLDVEPLSAISTASSRFGRPTPLSTLPARHCARLPHLLPLRLPPE